MISPFSLMEKRTQGTKRSFEEQEYSCPLRCHCAEQEKAENQATQNDANDRLKQENNELKANKLPTTYEGTVVAAATEKDPQRKVALESAAKRMEQMEIKKFTYAQRATGGGGDDDRRQPMIDAATEKINALNGWEFSPDANDGRGGFIDPKNQNQAYTPEVFTNMKNQISADLDRDLAKAKLRPLGVRFGVKATTPGVNPDGSLAAPAGAQPAPNAPVQTAPTVAPATPKKAPTQPPKPTAPAPEGATHMAPGSDGQWHYVDAKQRDLGVVAAAPGTVPTATAQADPAPPAGATHQYRDKSGKIVGYAVNGKYVAIGPQADISSKPVLRAGGGQQLTDQGLASQYLEKAGGDKEQARKLAKQDEWKF